MSPGREERTPRGGRSRRAGPPGNILGRGGVGHLRSGDPGPDRGRGGPRIEITANSRDLTGESAGSKLDGLPRRAAERLLVGVRLFLENSTACQKSMPNYPRSRGCVGACLRWVLVCLRVRIPLVEMGDSLWVIWIQPDPGRSFGVGLVFADVDTFGRAFGSAGVVLFINGEFDPGSGRTLAACLTHASRTVNPFGGDQWRTGE